MNVMASGAAPVVMVVDDDFDVLFTVSAFLQRMGYQVVRFPRPEDAMAALGESACDIIVSDIKMPGTTGLDLLEAARRICPETPFILMTGYGDLDTAVLAIKRGAFDFLLKPLDFELVTHALDKALRVRRGRELEQLYQERLEEDVFKKTAELRAAREELEIARNAAIAASRAKSEFLANVSHELRTPMNGIVGMLDLLSLADLAREQAEYVAIAVDSARDMMKLVDRLISFSSLGDDEALAARRFSLRELAAGLLIPAQSIAEKKGVAFSWAINRGVPDMLRGNDIAFGRALEAIAENAVKFTHEGRVDVTVAHSEVGEEVELLVVVNDTGIGIPPDRLGVIFDDFTQVDGSLTRLFGGMGLGLAAARKSATQAGGTLWVESREGEGSTFYFTARFACV